jgi:uncharacterized protein
LDTILQRLTDLDDVSGAILVGKDGLIVTGTLHSEDEEVVGAISAAAFGSITSFIDQINHGHNGTMHHVIIETQNGAIQFEEVGDLILVVTTRHGINLGRIRIEMKKACRQIHQFVASY